MTVECSKCGFSCRESCRNGDVITYICERCGAVVKVRA